MSRHLITLAMIGLLAAAAGATPTITVGTQYVGANMTGQTVQVMVSGGDQVTGFNLRAELGNGTEAGAEPVFQSVSFAGGMWDAYANTTRGGPLDDSHQLAWATVKFISPVSVPASGLLVTLTVDTTGFTAGSSFPLMLKSTQLIGADSTFVLVGDSTLKPTITNGTLVVLRSGDANHDAYIDDNDLGTLLGSWGTGADWSHGDFNGDKRVDDNDLGILLGNWTGSGAAAPEPATLSLLALGGAAMLRRRR